MPPNFPPIPEPLAPHKRPTRERKPPQRYEAYSSYLKSAEVEGEDWKTIDCVYEESAAALLATETPNNEPRSFTQTVHGLNKNGWSAAMAEELESLEGMKIWEEADAPANRKPIGFKWVYRIKYNADGNIARYKARLVAKGYSQVSGLDYGGTFSPVTRLETIRLFLGMAVNLDLEVRQRVMKTAHLYGDLEEGVYLEPPPGIEIPEGKALRRRKALYGLSQAGRQ